MANIIDVIFVAEFIVAIGLFLCKVFNVMSLGRFYMVETLEDQTQKLSMKIPLLIFIANGILLGLGNITVMFSLEAFMAILYRFQALFFMVTIFMTIFEFFLYLASTVDNTTVKARNSLKQMEGNVNKGITFFR